jgi:hypothetical protein
MNSCVTQNKAIWLSEWLVALKKLSAHCSQWQPGVCTCAPFYLHSLTLIHSSVSDHMKYTEYIPLNYVFLCKPSYTLSSLASVQPQELMYLQS